MKRREPQISGTGMFLVTMGTVVGLGLWMAAIFGLGNTITHENMSKLPAISVDPNVSSSGSSTGNSTGSGTTGSGGGTSTATSSGGPNGMPFAVSQPANTKLMATSMPGFAIFQNTCATCHGTGLQGVIGPELLGIGNVATEAKLLSTVKSGFPSMMPPAGGLTNVADVKKVVAWLMQQKQK